MLPCSRGANPGDVEGYGNAGSKYNLLAVGALPHGLYATCYTLKRQDAEYFGGHTEAVLARDVYRCRWLLDYKSGAPLQLPPVSDPRSSEMQYVGRKQPSPH